MAFLAQRHHVAVLHVLFLLGGSTLSAGTSSTSGFRRWRSTVSMIRPTATAAAMATRMFSLSGSANAAMAAVMATPVASQVARSNSMDSITPSSARTPAKPRPHDSGTTLASKMPVIDGTCQDSQLIDAAPQKYGTCSGCGVGWG